MTPPRDDAPLLAELAAIYRDADALYAGWSCPASTECCQFGVLGREPYVTSIERAALERAVARRGGPLSTRRRALPMIAEGARTCPMLDRDGRCSVYADRPLGCRTYFCDRASGGAPPARAALTSLVRRLRDLAARHRPGGEQGQPLGRLLGV